MSNEKKTGKGARTEGAKTKGKAAAAHNLDIASGGKGKLKANPYSDARPGMRDAWQEAYDAAYAAGADVVSGSDEPEGEPTIAADDDEPDLSNEEISAILDAD